MRMRSARIINLDDITHIDFVERDSWQYSRDHQLPLQSRRCI